MLASDEIVTSRNGRPSVVAPHLLHADTVRGRVQAAEVVHDLRQSASLRSAPAWNPRTLSGRGTSGTGAGRRAASTSRTGTSRRGWYLPQMPLPPEWIRTGD
jgi:hypothetical protein